MLNLSLVLYAYNLNNLQIRFRISMIIIIMHNSFILPLHGIVYYIACMVLMLIVYVVNWYVRIPYYCSVLYYGLDKILNSKSYGCFNVKLLHLSL